MEARFGSPSVRTSLIISPTSPKWKRDFALLAQKWGFYSGVSDARTKLQRGGPSSPSHSPILRGCGGQSPSTGAAGRQPTAPELGGGVVFLSPLTCGMVWASSAPGNPHVLSINL